MNSSKLMLDAWMSLLDGQISVPVYKRVPEDAPSHYVWLRLESGFDVTNKRSFNDELTVVTDVVTTFENVGDDAVMEGVDSEIVLRVMPTPGAIGLTNPTGLQVLNLRRDQHYPPEEKDGIKVYLRKISRYTHRIHQTS